MKKSKVAIVTSQIWQVVEMIVGCCLAGFFALATILSIGQESFTTEPKVLCAVCIALGAFLIFNSIKRKKLIKAFKEYVQILAGDPFNSLDTIAEATNTSYDVVKKNVAQMIKKNYFANATIDDNARCLILNGKVDTHQVLNDKAQVSQAKKPAPVPKESVAATPAPAVELLSIKCKGCGAINMVGRGKVVECEYCGNMIKGE